MMHELNISSKDKILVVAPHADDETIGVGGLLALYGKQTDLLLLSDGRKGVSPQQERSEDEIIKIRKEEFLNVTAFFGVNSVTCLDIEDQTVAANKKSILSFPIKGYSYILVTSHFEGHIDHKVLLAIFTQMKKMQHSKAEILEYEVWNALPKPNLYLDISCVMNKKLEAVSLYKSQIESYDYVSMCKGINTYRGATNRGGDYEAYFSEKIAKLDRKRKLLLKLWGMLPLSVRALLKRARV